MLPNVFSGCNFFTKPPQDTIFNLFRDVVMGYRSLADILVENPIKECVGNRNTRENMNMSGKALISISRSNAYTHNKKNGS